ncbi:MAG: hypothetical protein EPN24_01550 [Candidatus Methanoperedens sp.]|nr:MAG: hypothetical protein EPN24_01550 [Candidatus Methanoperedens sp.]
MVFDGTRPPIIIEIEGADRPTIAGLLLLETLSTAEEKELENLEKENLKTIEEVYSALNSDKKIQAHIEKIKSLQNPVIRQPCKGRFQRGKRLGFLDSP